ncbi:MAG: glycosyltransferase family 4 protein [Patescibacteria group bacterium]|jgi:glycosyltransferase involved in cell wall biosynthesis
MKSEQKKIKIIYALPGLRIGGAERFTIDLIKNLDKEKFEAKLLILEGASEEAEDWRRELENERVEILDLKKRKGKDKIKCLIRYYKALKAENPDILHAQLFTADLFGRLAAGLAGIPLVITEQNLNYVDSWPRIILKRLTSFLSARVVAISEAVRNYLIKREGVPEDKLTVIYNGTETEKYAFNERSYEQKDKIIIGSVGRLTRQKGFEYLIEAVSKLESGIEIECLIAGDGEERANLEMLINKHGLQNRVKLIGWQKAGEFLKKIDIFVLPSVWEGLGIAVIEAGLSGLPVIASDIDGLREIITDSNQGCLFKPGDANDLKEKLEYLIGNADERKRLGCGLQRNLREKFSIKKIAGEYEELYRKILNGDRN